MRGEILCRMLFLLLPRAATAVFTGWNEADRLVKRTVAPEVGIATHAGGQADQAVGKQSLGLITLQTQAGEADLDREDFPTDGFGLADCRFEFIRARVGKAVGWGEQAPTGEEIPGPGEDMLVAELLHKDRREMNVLGRGRDATCLSSKADSDHKKFKPAGCGRNIQRRPTPLESGEFKPVVSGLNYKPGKLEPNEVGPGIRQMKSSPPAPALN